MNEIITDAEICWIFMYANNELITYPFEVVGIGQKVYYPNELTAVCCESESAANAEIIKLNLQDDRN